MLGGQPSTPPIRMVGCWDDLDPTTYTSRLSDLADWITWFRAAYRIPATVLPRAGSPTPHPRGHRPPVDRMAAHPPPRCRRRRDRPGLGPTPRRRDRPAPRSHSRHRLHRHPPPATRHQAEPEPAPAIPKSTEQLWQDHLNNQTLQRVWAVARQAAVDQVVEILQAAELRHDLAPGILAETADQPAEASDDDRAQVTGRLRQLAVEAVERVAQSASDAARAVFDTPPHEGAVPLIRADLPDLFAAAALAGQNTPTSDDLPQQRLDALETLLPASIAADRAAAAAAARTAAVDQRAAARRRNANIDDLLE